MGASTSPGRISLLLALFWSLFVLSAVAVPDNLHRRADYFARQGSNSTNPTSRSASTTGPTSASVSRPSSSSFSKSSSTPSSSSSSSSAISTTTTTSSRSSSSSTSTPSSSTSVITTTTTSSQSSSSSSLSSSTSTITTSKTSAALVTTPAKTSDPATTLDVSPDLATSSDNEPSSTASAASNVNAASSGFWGNKGAVGGTFTVVALAIVGILVAVGLVMRRRAAAHNSARDTFFDTKNPVDRVERYSSGPSMVSLGNEPMDSNATPAPNYGAADQYLVDTAEYNVSYPPGASYDHTNIDYAAAADHTNPAAQQYYATTADQHYPSATAEQDPYYAESNAYDSYNQYYAAAAPAGENGYSVAPAGHRPSLSPHPYSHPAHTSAAPPSALHDFGGRDSAYTTDSFYGAAGTAS